MNRWEIAKELNILSLPVIVFHYQNPVEESLHIIKANLQRRHLNEGQRAMLLLEMDSFQQELEQQRQEAKDRQGTRTDLTSVPQGTNVENGKSVDKVAKAKGVSPRTMYRAKAVKKANPQKAKRGRLVVARDTGEARLVK